MGRRERLTAPGGSHRRTLKDKGGMQHQHPSCRLRVGTLVGCGRTAVPGKRRRTVTQQGHSTRSATSRSFQSVMCAPLRRLRDGLPKGPELKAFWSCWRP